MNSFFMLSGKNLPFLAVFIFGYESCWVGANRLSPVLIEFFKGTKFMHTYWKKNWNWKSLTEENLD